MADALHALLVGFFCCRCMMQWLHIDIPEGLNTSEHWLPVKPERGTHQKLRQQPVSYMLTSGT